jgi:hypothetical protein
LASAYLSAYLNRVPRVSGQHTTCSDAYPLAGSGLSRHHAVTLRGGGRVTLEGVMAEQEMDALLESMSKI